MAGQHGGARPGAGRKPKNEIYRVPIRKAEKKIADRLPEIVDRALELAMGVTVQDINPITNERTVYEKPPDLGAIKYLLDRIMGKPTETKEHFYPDRPLEELTEDELRQIRDS